MPFNLNWLDFAALLILCIYTVDGLVKGLVLSIFKTAGFIVAIYGAKLLTPGFSGLMTNNTDIYASLSKIFSDKSPSSPSVAPVLSILGAGNADTGNVLTTGFISILSFIILFFLIRLILTLIANAFNMTTKLPVVKQFNKLGGFCFGLIKGALILYIIFAALTPILPLLPSDNTLIAAINSSIFASNFYKYNIIVIWINTFWGK